MRQLRTIAKRSARTAACMGLAALLSLVAAGTARATGIHAELTPGHVTVEPDSTFTLDLDVTPAGGAFNSFAAAIGFDPSALTFLPAAPLSLQEGCLMTGTCSSACGVTFHHFTAAGDSLVINESLLCDSLSLTGPGQIYSLRFRAAHTDQTTFVRVRRIVFFNAGVFATPVTSTDAQVDIHRTTSVAPGAVTTGLRIGVVPNPARGALSLSIDAGASGEQSVDVLDLAGRLVRRLDQARYAPGARVLRWDGAGNDGSRLPSGVYVVRVRTGGAVAQSRVVLLR
jgi:hypothetical protein